jgi:hypothetical protein
MPITPRELILRKLAAATAQVRLCEELLDDIDAGEASTSSAGQGNEDDEPPVPKKKPGQPSAAPKPAAPGHAVPGRENLVKIARALDGQDRTQSELVATTGIAMGSITSPLAKGREAGYWHRTDAADARAPFRLTAAGREELLGNGVPRAVG